MEIGARIKELRLSRGWSLLKLAEKVDMNHTTISRYEAGRIEMTAQTLQRIAEALEVPITALLGIPESQVDLGPWEAIPILGRIPAGELKFTEQTIEGYRMFPVNQVQGGTFFCLRITGDCMAPRFQNGDLALVRVQSEVENGEAAIVVADEEDATLKRVYCQGNTVVLRADNPKYAPIILPTSRVRIVGKVVGGAFDL